MSDFVNKFGHGVEDALSLKKYRDAASNAIDSAKSALGFSGSKPSSGGGADPGMVAEANKSFVDAAAKPKPAPKPAPKPKTPSYEKGTDFVPKTGPARLHKGEAVLNKADADKHRALKGAAATLGGDKPAKEIHEMTIKKVKGKNAHVITHHHTHPHVHPSETHTTEGTDGLMSHVMDHMSEPNPGEAEADAGQAQGMPDAGAGAQGAPPTAPMPGV